MFIFRLLTVAVMFLTLSGIASFAQSGSQLIPYSFDSWGFSIQYPESWNLVTESAKMIEIQDGSIDLIREENLSDADKSAYKAMVHVGGSPRYLSNIVFLVRPHNVPEGTYKNSEEAVQAVRKDFEEHRESGTYFLQETYFGESHSYVYRRSVKVDSWKANIRITYYIASSVSRAYMIIETRVEEDINAVQKDNFNQVIQSFRILDNETMEIDPSLDWGAVKPGEDTEGINLDTGELGQIEIVDNFNDRTFGWVQSDYARIKNGFYSLNSTDGGAFTVTNEKMGSIGFDFSYEGKIKYISGDRNTGYGLVFGYRDEDNYFAFLMTQSGNILVISEKNGKVTELLPWKQVPISSSDTHTLMVQGNYHTVKEPERKYRYELVFLVNNVIVARLLYDEVLEMSGGYGVFVSGGMNIEVDYLKTRNYLVEGLVDPKIVF